MPSTSRPNGSPAAADRLAEEKELLANLSLLHFRSLKMASLRWAAALAFPIWLEAEAVGLPGVLVWPLLLAQASSLALAGGFAALEFRWRRRARQLETGPPPAAAIHAVWSDWDELRAALWYGMAVVSLILWAYVGFGRRMPAPLLSALSASAAALFLLVVVAETLAQRQAVRRRLAGYGGAARR
jgi:hypothetical protein